MGNPNIKNLGRKIQKGQVLNPNGRPKKAESITNLLKEFGDGSIIDISYIDKNGDSKRIKIDSKTHSINALLAGTLISMAIEDRNLGAIKEIADRTEGKTKEQEPEKEPEPIEIKVKIVK